MKNKTFKEIDIYKRLLIILGPKPIDFIYYHRYFRNFISRLLIHLFVSYMDVIFNQFDIYLITFRALT